MIDIRPEAFDLLFHELQRPAFRITLEGLAVGGWVIAPTVGGVPIDFTVDGDDILLVVDNTSAAAVPIVAAPGQPGAQFLLLADGEPMLGGEWRRSATMSRSATEDNEFIVRNGEVLVEINVIAPPAEASAPSGTYHHVQSIPSDTWVINHNLGFYPNVSAFVGGQVADTDVAHGSVNQTTLTWASPVAGTADLT